MHFISSSCERVGDADAKGVVVAAGRSVDLVAVVRAGASRVDIFQEQARAALACRARTPAMRPRSSPSRLTLNPIPTSSLAFPFHRARSARRR
jgi:hypothetical protein